MNDDQLDRVARLLIPTLERIADRNPHPPPSGEFPAARLRRWSRNLEAERAALLDQATGMAARMADIDADLRQLRDGRPNGTSRTRRH